MPVSQNPKTGKWRIGNGPYKYNSKKEAEAAYSRYMGYKYGTRKKKKK
jgi:hypothetical protein